MHARTAHSHYTDGRHTENKQVRMAHRKHARTDGTLYKTRTESIKNTHGQRQKAHRKYARACTGDTYTTHGQKKHIKHARADGTQKTCTHGRHTVEPLYNDTPYNVKFAITTHFCQSAFFSLFVFVK